MRLVKLVIILNLFSSIVLAQDYYPLFELSPEVSFRDTDKIAVQVVPTNLYILRNEDIPQIQFHLPISDEGYLFGVE